MKSTIVIPAYEPSGRFISFIDELKQKTDRTIIVVDDGSGEEYTYIFAAIQQSGSIVLKHPVNLGKGAALKTVMQFQLEHFPDAKGMVTADSDGQHRVQNILDLAERLDATDDALILGTRDFTKEGVPFKSRYGNKITAFLYRFATGVSVNDTQTGLRGIPQSHLPVMLVLPGERFDYEMNQLMKAKEMGLTIEHLPIETVYFEDNDHSHFRPFLDSYLVYQPFLKFAGSSLLSAGADILLFTLLFKMVLPVSNSTLFLATALARIMSGLLNYQLNKHIVFGSKSTGSSESVRYAILFVVQLALSWFFVQLISQTFTHIVLLKMLVDLSIFVLSFYIQRKFVFRYERSSGHA